MKRAIPLIEKVVWILGIAVALYPVAKALLSTFKNLADGHEPDSPAISEETDSGATK